MLDALDALTHWTRHGNTLEDGYIERTLRFRDFKDAFAFMVEVAEVSETQSHHPDWSNSYNRVTMKLTSHDVKKLTDRDLTLALAIDAIAARYTLKSTR